MDEKILEKARIAFVGARLDLAKKHPFWGHLVMKLDVRWVEFEQPGTGQPGLTRTDGEHLDINPTMFMAITAAERVSVLVHEAAHCAAGHLFRCGSREPVRWNVAGDVWIANMQASDGFTIPQGCIEFFRAVGIRYEDFAGQPTEVIYEKMPQQKQSKGQGQGKGQGDGNQWNAGKCFDESHNSKARAEGEARWKQAVIEASQVAGDKAGAYDELIKAAMPKPPFHLKLFDYLSRGIGGDTTWETLNRRCIHQGLYLPSDTKQVMGEIAVAVDTSGSMSSEQLTLAFGYIRAFREQHPCKLHLIQCDYDAISKGQYKLYDDYEQLPSTFKAIGRGGTQFDPPFKLLRQKRIEPRVMIYLTDGYGAVHSEKRPHYPVLWVVLKGDKTFQPPFGDVVQVG